MPCAWQVRELVQELAGQTGLVVGAGGGVVLDSRNIEDFARTGLVVCLTATAERILDRVKDDTNRPLLETDDKMQKILSLLDARSEFYNAIPCQIDTTDLTIDEVVDQILAHVD